ncbi:MAG: hypothetical protein VYD57_18780 [Pseudomonadota bacterium]|nr:hypothetical protein [Pseudomonadota bacterium]
MSGEWVSITEAAARLSAAGDIVDRSTLSRYVSQHAEALETRREGRSNLVEFGALAQHRSENVRLRPIVAGTAAPAPVARNAQPSGQRRFAGTQSDGVARKALADAELREMELAAKRRQLTPTAEVDRAGREAVALMTSAFERAIETEAAEVSLRFGWDERQARVAFKKFARQGLAVFHREMLDRLDQMRRAADSGTADVSETAGHDGAASSELRLQ